jgi:hypothetical protein
MSDSVSPPTMVHARGTPCTFSIILRKSREHLEQQPPQIVVVRIRALPLVRIPSAWKSFPNTFEVSAELGSERCPLSVRTLIGLNGPANIYGHANTALGPGCSHGSGVPGESTACMVTMGRRPRFNGGHIWSVLDNLTCIYVINKMYISLNGRWNLWR